MDFKNAFVDDLLFSVNEFKPIKHIAWIREPFTLILVFGKDVYSFNFEDKMKLYKIIEELCDEYEYDCAEIKKRLSVVEDIVDTGKKEVYFNYL